MSFEAVKKDEGEKWDRHRELVALLEASDVPLYDWERTLLEDITHRVYQTRRALLRPGYNSLICMLARRNILPEIEEDTE